MTNSSLPLQVEQTFSSASWKSHHETWKDHRYTWLPSWQDIPKHLHEALGGGHLTNLKVSFSSESSRHKHANPQVWWALVYFLA